MQEYTMRASLKREERKKENYILYYYHFIKYNVQRMRFLWRIIKGNATLVAHQAINDWIVSKTTKYKRGEKIQSNQIKLNNTNR